MESESTVIKEFEESFKRIREEGVLFCPKCKRFTPFTKLKFFGKDSEGFDISDPNPNAISRFEGYKYICSKCGTRINSQVNLGDIEI